MRILPKLRFTPNQLCHGGTRCLVCGGSRNYLPLAKLKNKIEQEHNTTNKMNCAPSKDSDQPWRLLITLWVAKDPNLLQADSKDCQIRLGAQVILFVLSCSSSNRCTAFEPPHDKTNKMSVRPAKTQISLGIRPVWLVFAVCMKKVWVLSYPLSAQRRLWTHT